MALHLLKCLIYKNMRSGQLFGYNFQRPMTNSQLADVYCHEIFNMCSQNLHDLIYILRNPACLYPRGLGLCVLVMGQISFTNCLTQIQFDLILSQEKSYTITLIFFNQSWDRPGSLKREISALARSSIMEQATEFAHPCTLPPLPLFSSDLHWRESSNHAQPYSLHTAVHGCTSLND